MPASAANRTRGRTALPRPSGAAAVADLRAALERDFFPGLSVNGVIFGADAGTLRVLLMRWLDADAWGLPGGYVRRDEDVDAAAARMVRELTGLEGVYLRQFHTFGRADRALGPAPAAARSLALPADHWIFGRVVSVGYVALVDAARARVAPDPVASAMTNAHGWYPVAERPPLVLDHAEMIDRALAALRAGLDDLPLGDTLLPGAFTMPELQRLYETVLGRAFDRRNFLNRMLDLGLVERLPGQRVSRVSRPLNLYRWAGRDGAPDNEAATG
ncbi:DNA mismatch repair protein MutT [Gemmatimonadetes bacterium T265]|nr:DNA mismatch repair protein MutT [Gemmatimonadetes bacterium T265]